MQGGSSDSSYSPMTYTNMGFEFTEYSVDSSFYSGTGFSYTYRLVYKDRLEAFFDASFSAGGATVTSADEANVVSYAYDYLSYGYCGTAYRYSDYLQHPSASYSGGVLDWALNRNIGGSSYCNLNHSGSCGNGYVSDGGIGVGSVDE